MCTSSSARLVPSCRLTFSVMSCLILVVLYMQRNVPYSTLICMLKAANGSSLFAEYNDSSHHNSSVVTTKGEFEWGRHVQGFVLSAYSYGYLVTQILGGWLADRYGGKHVAGVGLFAAVILTMLTPSAARLSAGLMIATIVLLGAFGGVISPAMMSLYGHWAPPSERSFLTTVAYMGMPLGIMCAFACAAFCDVRVDNGWPIAFYFSGFVGFAIWMFWNLLIFNSPESHPRISEEERAYIMTGTGRGNKIQEQFTFSWSRALVSPALLCNYVGHACSAWFVLTLCATLPLYMKEVLRFHSASEIGLLLMLPNAGILVVSIPIGYFSDFIIGRNFLSIKSTRRLSHAIATFCPALLLVILGFLDHTRRYVAVGAITTAFVAEAFNRCSIFVNPQDVAPMFLGKIFGIIFTLVSLGGILGPSVAAFLTPHGFRREWQTVFNISAGLLVVSGIGFLVFAEFEVLEWAKGQDKEPLTPEHPDLDQPAKSTRLKNLYQSLLALVMTELKSKE